MARQTQALARICDVISRHAQEGRAPTALPRVRLERVSALTPPAGETLGPSVSLVVQGTVRTVLCEKTSYYGAGEFVVASVGLPVTCAVTGANKVQPYLAISISLQPAIVSEMLLAAPAPRQTTVSSVAQALATGIADPDLLDVVERLTRLLDRPADAAGLQPLYERELLWRLITGKHGQTVRQIGLPDSHLSQLSHAISWIRTHYDQPFSVEELAARASMSVTSFHRHFRAITQMTPLQYQKHLRLHEARTRLLAHADDVAGVGYAVGYGSPSQFSREYRRMFGAPPRNDAAHLRETSAT
ncbi:AraC family transcriptional regulator [Conexibacter sp. CPCC 206217]|uniref:AraC family transcriptional regulator n=1 Tax=Conexibacter sp. CPCC 206217 TaxID=3064574 RepID=UPI002721612D|nr:AraC family transcriptional regulator [Conexibacter sp. CPCC 206217]MDO8208989.1 AraC family transcriptional regulator [Conexibacter sp. CPCC 206217]